MASVTETPNILPPVKGTAQFLLESCSLVLPTPCCHEFLVDMNFLHESCLKIAISKGVGYGIIVASTLVKMPQVLKIAAAKSGTGISIWGVILELMAISFSAAYAFSKGYPFTAWGESLFLLVETAIIAILVLVFSGQKLSALFFTLTFSGIFYALMSGLTPINILWSLQACNLPLAVTGKMVQAYRNWMNGHTGQMSVITVWMLFLGCVARVFTTLQETGDQLVMATFAGAAAANFVLVSQVHYYWKVTDRILQEEQKIRIKKSN